jgi:hypothetical protein
MSDIISKELLSIVFGGEKVQHIIEDSAFAEEKYYEELEDSEVLIVYAGGAFNKWNIHELAHKCKEWAFKEGYTFSFYRYKIDNYRHTIYIYKEGDSIDGIGDVISFDTEPEAIFKACQWILDNK